MNETPIKTVRGYELRTAVGSGGFGTVYHAYQPVITREVAVKVIRDKYVNDPQFIRRFEAEARIIARLEHPHIVPLYDYWRDPEGAYLVMRWLRGGSVRDRMKQERFSIPMIVRILNQIASALELAHSQNIIHRDIKPENLLMDEQDNVYLSDFGIAVDLVREVDLVAEYLSYGSPEYVAPEQLTDKVVSPRSDVYSLGIMLYEMLTNARPFSGNTTREIVKMQVRNPVPSLKLSRPDLPSDMDTIIWQATAKRPEVRYEDAMTLAMAFQQAATSVMKIPASYRLDPSISAAAGDSAPSTGRLEDSSYGTADLTTGSLGTMDLATGQIDLRTADLQGISPLVHSFAASRPVNPYKGLRPFEEGDAEQFHGRDDVIARLMLYFSTDDRRFLALIGPSGSGKSSLVRAGVIPAIRRGAISQSEQWFITSMVPGADPFQALSEALLRVAVNAPDDWGVRLRDRVEGLHNLIQAIIPESDAEIVIFIDQFEEVFTLCESEEDRNFFLGALYYALIAPESRLRLILTLRADFYDRPLYYAEFGELVRQHTEVVLPLSKAELEAAITKPALQSGIIIEKPLTEAMIEDVYNQPGALPLLQYTLTEMYERSSDTRLTLDDYRTIGGVSGALAQRAHSIYEQLAEPSRIMAQQIFLRLITLGEGAKVTRRRVVWPELTSGIKDLDTFNATLDQFSRRRLLTLDRDPVTRSPTVEVAHEALIAEWAELQHWVEQNRADLLRVQQLRVSVDEWLKSRRDKSYLASGARLGEFESLLYTNTLALGKDEREYIESSILLRESAARRARMIIIALAAFSVVTLVLAILAVISQRQALDAEETALRAQETAVANEQVARSRELASNALANLENNDLSLLVSIEAVQISQTYEAMNSLLTGLQVNPFLTQYLAKNEDTVRTLAYSPDGAILASAGGDNIIRLWDVANGTMQGDPLIGHEARVNRVAFSPDGELLASAGADGKVLLWSMSTGEKLAVFEEHQSSIWGLAFSPDGRMIASSDENGTFIAHMVRSHEVIYTVSDAHGGIIYDMAFSPDGDVLASGGDDNLVRLWDASSGEVLATLGNHDNWVLTIAFSPNGKTLASSGVDNRILFWDLETLEQRGALSTGHRGWVRDLSYSESGQFIASASEDGSIRVWLTENGQGLAALTAHTDAVWGVAFRPDPNPNNLQLASGSSDGHIALWRLALPQRPGNLDVVTSVAVEDLSASQDHALFAIFGGGGDTGIIQVWDHATNEIIFTADSLQREVTDIALSPDGSLLAASGADGHIVLYDLLQKDVLMQLTGHESIVSGVIFTPDGTQLISADELGTIMRWDLSTFDVVHTLSAETGSGGVTSLAISDDGLYLAMGGRDDLVRVWNLESNLLLGDPLQGHRDAVETLAFDRTNSILASGSRDGTIILWDFLSGSMLQSPLEGHTSFVFAIEISPDNRYLASAGNDGTARLWDLRSARPVGMPLIGHQDRVTGLHFASADSLITTGHDATVLAWDLSLDYWIEQACSIANRNLSIIEWSQFLHDQPYEETCAG